MSDQILLMTSTINFGSLFINFKYYFLFRYVIVINKKVSLKFSLFILSILIGFEIILNIKYLK